MSSARLLWSCVIDGHMPSMKNSRIPVPAVSRAGKPYIKIIKSAETQAWMRKAVQIIALHRPQKPIAADCTMYARIYYPSRRSDLSVETLMDVLQAGAVIENDRLIRRVIADALIDAAHPRVAVCLAPITEQGPQDAATIMATIADLSAELRAPHRDRIGRAA